MADGFAVDARQIRAHATKIDEVRERFSAIEGASSAIIQDHAAYGMLCGWISATLHGRHVQQDELYAYVAENLRLAADALVRTGQAYEQVDDDVARRLRRAGGA